MEKSTLISGFMGFYLGYSLGVFCGITVIDWRFWVIAIPVIVLAEWAKRSHKKEE